MDNYSLIYVLRQILHYGLHFFFPAVVAFVFFRQQWKKAGLIMILTNLIDLDHLLVSPIFDPTRCSINFHFLHTCYAIAIYAIMIFFNKTRIIGIGLLLHILIDFLDCLWI